MSLRSLSGEPVELNGVTYKPRLAIDTVFDSISVGLPRGVDTPMMLKELDLHKLIAVWRRHNIEDYEDVKYIRLDKKRAQLRTGMPINAPWIFFHNGMEGVLKFEIGRHTTHALFEECHNTAVFAFPVIQEPMFDYLMP